MFDHDVPPYLKELQEWFGKIISLPLNTRSQVKEVSKHILPGPKLNPLKRIKIYQQQYWFRLLNALHENFPGLTRIFGYNEFNKKIGGPYIHSYPPTHYLLSSLGDYLVFWLENHYRDDDKELVLKMATIDWAMNRSFCCASFPKLPKDIKQEILLNSSLKTQPHVHLFFFKANYFQFRDDLLKKGVDHYNINPFPKLDNSSCQILLFRDLENIVTWKKIPFGAYLLLNFIKQGLTITESCQKLELIGGGPLAQAEEEMSLWLFEWISKDLLTI